MTATIAPHDLRPLVLPLRPRRARHPQPARASEATYRRRRAVVGTVLAIVVATGIVVTHDVLAGPGGVPASAAAGLPAPARTTITAQPGDSLWSIARAHRGDVPITRYVDKLVSLNGGPSIQAGQAVVLP